jgi:ribosomal protein L2
MGAYGFGMSVSGETRVLEGVCARRFYMVSAEGQNVGDVVTWPMRAPDGYGVSVPLDEWSARARMEKARVPGAVVCLRDVSVGAHVYNVEMTPGSGGKMVRSAGTSAMVQRVSESEAWLRLPSGVVRRFSLDCRATLGMVYGENHALEMLGKAGVSRHMSIRPRTRGCAKNPIDHPHGGRTRGGRPEMTPWARVAKGKPTRKTKSVFVVV